jgi:DNA polymerase-3 subunit beta
MTDRELLEKIQNLSRAVATKATIPVLEGIFIEAKEGKLKLIAYNLELGMTKEIEANIKEEGSIVINAKMLSEMVRRLSGVNVTLSSDDKLSCKIESDKTVFELMGMNPNDFPELPDVDETYGVTIPSDVLKDMVRQTIFAAASPDLQKPPIYSGLLFDIKEDGISMVGVDGFRLAVRNEKLNLGVNTSFVIAAKTISETVKIITDDSENIDFYVGNRHVSMCIDGYTVISRKIEGEFFDYKKTIPASFATTVNVNTKEIVSIIDRISLIINDHIKTPTRCNIENDQIVFSCSTGLGRATDSYKVEVNGDTFEIGINSRYLLEALKACETDEAVVNFNGPFSVIIIKPTEGDDYLYMMMPTRLKAE